MSSVNVGQTATISARFQNETESVDGAATFDLRLAVDPPGFNNTVYYEWPNESFTRNQRRTFTQSYTFSQEGDYEITAYIYDVNGKENSWSSSHRFDSHSEDFEVEGADYDAEAEDVSLSLSTIYAGQTATISARFQNETESVDGAATFDLRLAVDPPGFRNTFYYEWLDQPFTRDQQRTFNQDYTFSQAGDYEITAYIYDVDGKENSWSSSRRFDSRSEDFEVSSPTYDADAEDISLSVSSVNVGQTATISARFQNETESVDGAATFDLRLAVDPPGFLNTVYYEWPNESFTRNQRRTFTQRYAFSQEGDYEITAYIYDVDGKENSWSSSHRFDSHSEDFEVEGADYDAEAEDVSLSLSSIYAGQTATISARFQNETESVDGAATFDLRLAVDPPGFRNTVYYEWPNESFTRNQRRTFTQSYTFSQEGDYEITAYIYDVDGKENSWSSSRRFDSRSEDFEVSSPTYDADAEDVSLSATPAYIDQAVAISAQFQNLSPAGVGTFDLRLAVDPPGFRNTVYFEWPNQSFDSNQQRNFTQTYSLLQVGEYQITAEIYDDQGKENNWSSAHRFDSRSESFTVNPYDFDADAEDVSLAPSTVNAGQSATVTAQFRNATESANGEGRFDLRLAVDPPGSNNTVYYEWLNQSFSRNQPRTFTQTYTFSQGGEYQITAEIFNINGKTSNWSSSNRFDSHSESFQVGGGTTYDADAEDISLAPSTVIAGQSATISAQFRNATEPVDGEGRFDLRLAVDPPGFGNTVYYEWPNQSFFRNQQRTFTQTYTFSEGGEYQITAEIFNIDGKTSNWSSSNRFDSHSESFTVGGGTTYDADAEEISLAPSTVIAGQSSTISAQFRNATESVDGEGRFDLRLAVDPPGFGNTVYYEWPNQSFFRNQQRTFTQTYTFSQGGEYQITAEIFNIDGKTSNWSSSNRFDSHSEDFEVNSLTYQADAEDISLSSSTVIAGQSATISAQFQNLSPAGAGTFDLRLAVDPPGLNNTVYYEWLNQSFTREQERTFTQDYTFGQGGKYQITAEIFNINGKTSNWSSSNRFDSHSVSFTEQGSTTITTSDPPTVVEQYAVVNDIRQSNDDIWVPSGESVSFDATATDPDGLIESIEWYINEDSVSLVNINPPQKTVTRNHSRQFHNTSGSSRVDEIQAVFKDDSGGSTDASWNLTVVQLDDSKDCPRRTWGTSAITVREVSSTPQTVRPGDEVTVSVATTTGSVFRTVFYVKVSIVDSNDKEVSGKTVASYMFPKEARWLISRDFEPITYKLAIPKDAVPRSYTVKASLWSENLSEECHSKEAGSGLRIIGLGTVVGGIGKVPPIASRLTLPDDCDLTWSDDDLKTRPNDNILYTGVTSSFAIGPVDVYDTHVAVNLTSPVAGQSLRTLTVRLDHDPLCALVYLGDDLRDTLRELAENGKLGEIEFLLDNLFPRNTLRPVVEKLLKEVLVALGVPESAAGTAAVGLSYVIVPPIEGVVADKLLWAVNALSDGLDALEDNLVYIGLSRDIAKLMVNSLSIGASLATLNVVGGPVGPLVPVLLIDAILAFDGYGQITIAVPNSVWVEFGQGRNLLTKKWLSDEHKPYTLENERNTQLFAATFGLVSSLIPGIGHAILAGEYLSVWLDEEYPSPQDPLFSPQYRNCTTRIQVPWNFWMAPYRGIMTQIPLQLTGDEYIAITGHFSTISTWKQLADINIPFVRERGFFEIGDALGTGKEPPPCESSQFPQ